MDIIHPTPRIGRAFSALACAVPLALIGCGAPEDGAPDGTIDDSHQPSPLQQRSVQEESFLAPWRRLHLNCSTVSITSPPNGTTLRAKVQTFTWTGGDDDYWLRIGSRPFAADVYRSGRLENVTSQTVSNLPLNGAPLYVELLSRSGRRFSRCLRRYDAAVRRGLAIVVDFADSRLEDWQEPPDSTLPPGFHDVGEIRTVLDQMTDHWEWLSRGTEKVVWGLTRIQLSEDFVANAFPAYPEFRRAVMDRANVDPEEYDQDADGIIEGMWMIVSAKGHQGDEPGYGYLSGGSALVGNVKSFVDNQGSFAVRYRRYGAFNHEFAHAVALPDLYGRYSTVNGLTLMGTGVEHVPADDLCAWGREQLGWLHPTVVTRSKHHVVVPSANDRLAALKVPTARPYEYFLIEYRKTPASGYGSLEPPYDGLAVYHAFNPSTQNQNPPLLKLEPAGAPMFPEAEAEPQNLFYPENGTMTLPRVMRSYLTDAPVFRIDRVERTRRGMAVDIEVLGDGGPISAPNLVQNPSAEDGTDSPDSWARGDNPATYLWSTTVAHTGTHSLSVSSQTPTDAEWHQHVDGLAPGQSYLLCGWLKGQDIVRYDTKRAGGTVSLSGSFDQAGPLDATFDWTERCLEFQAETASPSVACRLGGFSATASGTLWCDDFSVIALPSAF